MSQEKLEDTQLKSALETLYTSLQEENSKSHEDLLSSPRVVEAIAAAKTGDMSAFYYKAIYPMQRAKDAIVDAVTDNRYASFMLEHSEYVERIIEKTLTHYEGSACCVDKSRTIVEKLLMYYIKGEPIVFNYEQQYTYHLPKKVLNTQDKVVGFLESLRLMYYGSPAMYMSLLHDMDGVK